MAESIKEQVMSLWRICFNDTEGFIRLFFDEAYSDETVLTEICDGKVVCALQMLPYTLNYYGSELPVTYIYGVCTHPAYRRRGFMSKLFRECFKLLRRRGSALAFLIPAHDWLFDCYRKLGFTETFYISESIQDIPKDNIVSQHIIVAGIGDVGELHRYLKRQLLFYPISVLHSEKQLLFYMKEIEESGGKVFVYRDDKEVKGFIMSTDNENYVMAHEVKADSEHIRQSLFSYVASYFEKDKVWYRDLAGYGMKRLGMSMILDPESYLAIQAQSNIHKDNMSVEKIRQMSSAKQTAELLDTASMKGYLSLMLDL